MFGKFAKSLGHPSREYFLHLGLHKTATTALQEYLTLVQRQLASNGILYVHLKRMRSEITPLMCSSSRKTKSKLNQVLQAFPHSKVLLSDENILGGPGDIPLGMLYPYAQSRIISFCEDVAPAKVTLFITLRSPATFVTSMYCEYIRHNDYIVFDEYINAFDISGFQYSSIFSWLGNLPNNARYIMTPFEQDLGGGVQEITTRILNEINGSQGHFDLGLFPKKLSRSSYSLEEVDLATTIAGKAGPKAAHVFLNSLDGHNMRFGSTKFLPMDESVSRNLHENYKLELQNQFK